MAKKIERLTPEQEAMLPSFVEYGLRYSLSTEPCDRPKAEAAIRAHYAALGRDEPRLIIWLDSPHQGAIGAAILAGSKFSGDQVGAQVRDQVGAQVWNQVRAQVYRAGYGAQDMGWVAWFSAMRAIGADLPDSAATIAAISENVGWWWPFERAVIATERPRVIHFDSQRQLHCENGPAVRYADGFSVYCWHGRRVPQNWIEQRNELDPAEIVAHENVEMRAIGAAIIGWPRMLSVLKAKVIDDSGSPDVGQLIELKLPGLREPGRFLKAECPRNGIIVEGVPHVSDIDGLPINTAIAAQAWRIGDPQAKYAHPPHRT